jgi:hypothetical protein
VENMADKDAKNVDRASSSQFVMIGIGVLLVLILLAWHPWVNRPVNGVPQSVTATASP